MRKSIAVLGGNGLLGSDLVKFLKEDFRVTPITRDNYPGYLGKKFDVLINANGKSRRFWANQNPREDFLASTVSLMSSIFDFPTDLYIYISSPDIYENHTSPRYTKEGSKITPEKLESYGFDKYLSELIVKKYKNRYLILHPAMILGSSLKKGPIFDCLNNIPLFITLDSKIQMVTSQAIAEVIKILLDKSVTGEVFNVGGIGKFNFRKILKYIVKEIQISPRAEKQIYEMNVTKLRKIYPNLKTSEEYLKDFLKDNRISAIV